MALASRTGMPLRVSIGGSVACQEDILVLSRAWVSGFLGPVLLDFQGVVGL